MPGSASSRRSNDEPMDEGLDKLDYMGYCRRPDHNGASSLCLMPLPCCYHDVVQWMINKTHEDELKRNALIKGTED